MIKIFFKATLRLALSLINRRCRLTLLSFTEQAINDQISQSLGNDPFKIIIPTVLVVDSFMGLKYRGHSHGSF